MSGKMCFQLFIGCLVMQLLLMLLFIQLMVPLLHRELVLYWPVARFEQQVRVNLIFLLHATRDRLQQWHHDEEGNIKMSGRDLARLSYQAVFTAPEAHVDRPYWVHSLRGSFGPWPCGFSIERQPES